MNLFTLVPICPAAKNSGVCFSISNIVFRPLLNISQSLNTLPIVMQQFKTFHQNMVTMFSLCYFFSRVIVLLVWEDSNHPKSKGNKSLLFYHNTSNPPLKAASLEGGVVNHAFASSGCFRLSANLLFASFLISSSDLPSKAGSNNKH